MDGNRGDEVVVGVGEEGIGLAREAAGECLEFLRPLLARLMGTWIFGWSGRLPMG